jgi:hypothetical protein
MKWFKWFFARNERRKQIRRQESLTKAPLFAKTLMVGILSATPPRRKRRR